MENKGKDKDRNYVLLYVNGDRKVVSGENIFLPLSDYLRNILHLTGTKVVCAEGDCGACTVLRAEVIAATNGAGKNFHFEAVNSCIASVHLFDCSQIITVEGLKEQNGELNPVQQALVTEHGSQCGFCTPGFALTLTAMYVSANSIRSITEKEIKDSLTGNLCRCTGYKGIIDAGLHVANDEKLFSKARASLDVYQREDIYSDLTKHKSVPIAIETQNRKFYAPISIDSAIEFKKNSGNQKTYVFASATDLGVQINKEFIDPQRILSLNAIPELYEIKSESGGIEVGAKVSLTTLQNFVKDGTSSIPELYNLLNIFASPQIKNMGTLVGNVANGSPIGDTLPFLFVMEAILIIKGPANKTRRVGICDFFKGYKKFDLNDDELITNIFIPTSDSTCLKLYKVSKRKDLDISTINAAFLAKITKSADDKQHKQHKQYQQIEKINICYGGVAATPLRLKNTEKLLQGKLLDQANIDATVDEAVKSIVAEISPIADVRGSVSYRNQLAGNLFKKFIEEI
ncbi:MAG: FAD binding domain-containing protein [Oligoflexia bacterium]|nr:FAD binding domain-containing protein [Oligoflexia bacterium]